MKSVLSVISGLALFSGLLYCNEPRDPKPIPAEWVDRSPSLQPMPKPLPPKPNLPPVEKPRQLFKWQKAKPSKPLPAYQTEMKVYQLNGVVFACQWQTGSEDKTFNNMCDKLMNAAYPDGF